MANNELAKIFFEIAEFLEADNVSFKPYAYRKAALALEGMEEDAEAIYKEGGLKALEDIPCIGASIGQKMEEFILTGKIEYYEELKRKLPVDLGEITAVEGLGAKRAKVLYEKLGVKTLADLERAVLEHKIAKLPGFGEKLEQNILQGIEFQKQDRGRFLLGNILPRAREIQLELEKIKQVEAIEMAGSLRRRKETIGDVDFLAVVKDGTGVAGIEKVMDLFTTLPGVEKIWSKGQTKASIRLKEGFNADLRVLPRESYGAALQYFTGSKEHNIAVRRIAQDKGLKLSEYGLFHKDKAVAGKDEKEIYNYLGLQWMAPELRENTGEIEVARAGELPNIIGYDDLVGDLHCHSDWDGGSDSVEVLAWAAQEMGYEYIGIADHTKFLRIENGLDEETLKKRNEEIDKLNELIKSKGGRFIILKGCEANIMNDGSIDINDEALAELDFVIAGVHSNMKMEKKEMTARMIKAIENPNVDIISHPTGRLLKRRDEYEIDFEAICAAAVRTGTILEINSSPERMDLNDQYIRWAKDHGIKMAINTDAHAAGQLRLAEYGIAQARRGWAEYEDIINVHPLDKLKNFLKKR